MCIAKGPTWPNIVLRRVAACRRGAAVPPGPDGGFPWRGGGHAQPGRSPARAPAQRYLSGQPRTLSSSVADISQRAHQHALASLQEHISWACDLPQ